MPCTGVLPTSKARSVIRLTESFLPSSCGPPAGVQPHSSKLEGIGCCPSVTVTPSTLLTWDAVNNEHASPGEVAAPAVCGGIVHRQIVRAVSKASAQLAGMMGMSCPPVSMCLQYMRVRDRGADGTHAC